MTEHDGSPRMTTAPSAAPTGAAPAWTSTVTPVPFSPEAAAGACVDRPGAGETGDGWSLTIAGWVVGQSLPAREIHVLFDGALLRRIPVDVERLDVAARYPAHPADRVGFWSHVGLLGLPATARLEVVAVLSDATPVHLATIVVSHRPLATAYQPSLSPITVTSLGRMGTTWLMRLLGHHPEIVVHPEYPYELGMAKYWAHLLRVASGPADYIDSSHPETFTADAGHIGHNPYFGAFLAASPELNRWLGVGHPALVGACAQEVLDEFYGQVAEAAGAGITAARFFAEKGLPDHVPDVLSDLYPGARELILVRDIRDVICSAVAFDAKRARRSFGRESLDDDLEFVSQLHMDLGRLVRSWQRRQSTALLVRYESLITAPARTLREILGYLGVACAPDAVDAVLEAAGASTPELDAHRTTADPAASIGRWRTDLAKVHPDLPERCAELFSPLLAQLGYSVSHDRAHRMQRDVLDVLGRLDGPRSGAPAPAAGAAAEVAAEVAADV
jgi:hypothetical protein